MSRLLSSLYGTTVGVWVGERACACKQVHVRTQIWYMHTRTYTCPVNRDFYGQEVSPEKILCGEIDSPTAAGPLYDALHEVSYVVATWLSLRCFSALRGTHVHTRSHSRAHTHTHTHTHTRARSAIEVV